MASRTLHLKAGQSYVIVNQVVKDKEGNPIPGCSQIGNSTAVDIVSYEPSFGKFVGMKPGTSTVSVTFSNSSGAITVNADGDVNGFDTLIVDENVPTSASFDYSLQT